MENNCRALVPIKWATEWELRNLKGIIYRIYCPITNKNYIGKSINTFNRRYGNNWKEAKNRLSKLIKKDIKIYGKDNFYVEILESSIKDENLLLFLENFYSKKYNCRFPNGYNWFECGQKTFPMKLKGLIRDKDENLIKVFDTINFCRKNNLYVECLRKLINGKTFHYKDYHVEFLTLRESIIKQKVSQKIIKLYNINLQYLNKIYNIFNIREFCKYHKLTEGCVRELIYGYGNRISYKGWVRI